MADTSFDVVVVGGGPGGYVAAIRAAQLGLKTGLVESEHLGGICLNWGCIPTKALLRTSELYHTLQRADDFGIKVKEITIDIKKIVERSRAVAKRLSGGVASLLRKHRVAVFDGRGRLAGKGKLAVTKDGKSVADLTARHIVLATGARPRTLPGLEADGRLIWTYKEAMVPATLPKSVLVVGSGAIGIEFASFYRDLGAQVTVVEVLPRILPQEDEEISELARKAFAKQGMILHVGATVKALKRGADGVTATVAKGKEVFDVVAERAILAVGIVGNIENLGLEGTKVRTEKGRILTDPHLATDEPGVYAIGDVAGPPWLAHKASHEGIVCIETIAGLKGVHPLDPGKIPGCTYCRPQVASIGLSENRAREQGLDVKVGRFPLVGNGKAIALGEPDGLVKTVFDARTGALLGAHMIGAEVTELIQGFAIAKTLETTEADLIETIFPHPTLSEAMHEAVLDAYGRVIHI